MSNNGEIHEKQELNHYHGGQDIHTLSVPLKVDMSVTTNGLGPVKNWDFSSKIVDNIDHYPPINDIELISNYNNFFKLGTTDSMPVLFGNGATELIDLVLRNINVKTWKTNNVDAQYLEYENSCKVSLKKKLNHDDLNASLTIMVNPNNPTGDFLNWIQIEDYISNYVANDSYLIVDESMIFWNPNWRDDSFLYHRDYITNLNRTRNIKVIIIQSWTKIFACTGLRIGSMVVYDKELYNLLKQIQPPWSVNIVARDYIMNAWRNSEYLDKTHVTNINWRKSLIDKLKNIYPEWIFYGAEFTSYIWIDTLSNKTADRIVNISKENGYPIRHGKYGYEKPSFIRLGVRDPELLEEWFNLI